MENVNRKTYDKIEDIVDDIDSDSKEIKMMLGVVDYDAPYLLHYEVTLHLSSGGHAKISVLDFLSRIDTLQTISILEQKKSING